MPTDRFELPPMPVDELDVAMDNFTKDEKRLSSLLILHYDPRRFFAALAAANVARAIYRHVDR
jgi:hypothetical protein